MTKFLVIGGAAALAYLLVTSGEMHPIAPGDKAKPLPQGPPAQAPTNVATPQMTVVPGASSSVLTDAAQAIGMLGSLADAAKKFGIFGSADQASPAPTPAPAATATNGSATGSPDFGAAFF